MPRQKELSTSPELLEELNKGATKHQSAKELLEQRISFIYGSISSKSKVTRDQIRRVLDEGAGADDDSVRANGS